MNRSIIRRDVLVLGGVLLATGNACVSTGAYEQAQQNVEHRLRVEQRLSQELAGQNAKLKQRVDQMEVTLRGMSDDLQRADRESKDARAELLNLKMAHEQQRGRDRLSYRERSDSELESRQRIPERDDEAMRRMRELLKQLQSALDQASGKEPL